LSDRLQDLVVLVADGGDAGQGLVDVVTDRIHAHGEPHGDMGVLAGGVIGRGAAQAVEFVGEPVDLGLHRGGEVCLAT
jgi:hypothetical protein